MCSEEEKQTLLRDFERMEVEDRKYLAEMASFFAARSTKPVKSLPSLSLVVGGRLGEQRRSNPQGVHDGFPAFGVQLAIKTQ